MYRRSTLIAQRVQPSWAGRKAPRTGLASHQARPSRLAAGRRSSGGSAWQRRVPRAAGMTLTRTPATLTEVSCLAWPRACTAASPGPRQLPAHLDPQGSGCRSSCARFGGTTACWWSAATCARPCLCAGWGAPAAAADPALARARSKGVRGVRGRRGRGRGSRSTRTGRGRRCEHLNARVQRASLHRPTLACIRACAHMPAGQPLFIFLGAAPTAASAAGAGMTMQATRTWTLQRTSRLRAWPPLRLWPVRLWWSPSWAGVMPAALR